MSDEKRVMVGLSGGVDSSVAALLLRRQGYAVEGLFMKNWEDDDDAGYCAAEADLEDAEDVARSLGLTLHRVNFSSQYWQRVFTHFLAEYESGRTPNPDILCNREIKFRAFLDYAIELGAMHIATGHYARIARNGKSVTLLKGVDASKDQSYFLYGLDQEQLSRSLFPLGGYRKSDVRRLAAEAGLATRDKPDSTGICFIGERPFKAFLGRFLPSQRGEIRSVEGKLMGHHDGLMFYTLGQRKGLGIGGRRGGTGAPWFVVEKNLRDNILLVAQGADHPRLYSAGLEASELHWIAGAAPPLPLDCRCKTRYRQPDQACRVVAVADGLCKVVFGKPQKAVTPGQSVVFYDGDICLGGGIIRRTLAA